MRKTVHLVVASVGGLVVGATGACASAIVPTIVKTAGAWTNASLGNDGDETSYAVAPSGGMAVYDLGEKTNFSDVSITARDWIDGTESHTPDNFLIQVSASDDPNGSDWSNLPIASVPTASDIFGYTTASGTTYNAGRRVEFTLTSPKRYFRYVNTNTAGTGGAAIAEIQAGRPVLITDSEDGSSDSRSHPLNYATDGKTYASDGASTTFYNDGTSHTGAGFLILDLLVPQGQGVSALTLENPAHTNYLPAHVQVYSSSTDDASNFDTLVADTTLSGNAAGQSNTINLDQTVNGRYFKFLWTSNLNGNPAGGTTEIGDFGFETAPLPEPAGLGLLAAGGLLLFRRKRRV
jgi:hypothetical protein